MKILNSVTFNPGEKYYLRAKEKDTPEILAEVVVPEPPPEPTLISINREITTLSEPEECTGITTVKSAVMSFSFINNSESNQYYALLLEGTGFSWSDLYIPFTGLLDFSVRYCNTPVFFAVMHGLKMFRYDCNDHHISVIKSPVFAYFIDGSKIPDNKCHITLSIQYDDAYCVYSFFKSFRIKLLSIPKDMYFFEKSLYTYEKTSGDPFTEPIYLEGNIIGGNGVFALCRSSELNVH